MQLKHSQTCQALVPPVRRQPVWPLVILACAVTLGIGGVAYFLWYRRLPAVFCGQCHQRFGSAVASQCPLCGSPSGTAEGCPECGDSEDEV
jgi:hypothetical protein